MPADGRSQTVPAGREPTAMPDAAPTRMLSRLGARTAEAVADLGRFGRFTGRVFTRLVGRGARWRLLSPQLYEIGVRSIPVVAITGLFVGMVLAVQVYEQMNSVAGRSRAGLLVNLSVVREIGPVLAGVMLAGRIGSAMAAELGTMKVSEQIDALESLAADPVRYLVAPRFLACLLLIPFLTVYGDVVGVLGGYAVIVGIYGEPSGEYWHYSAQGIETFDVVAGIVKSLFFGAAIALISCYKGFHSRSGAAGVGSAATEAFVQSFIVILILNLFLTVFFQALTTLLGTGGGAF